MIYIKFIEDSWVFVTFLTESKVNFTSFAKIRMSYEYCWGSCLSKLNDTKVILIDKFTEVTHCLRALRIDGFCTKSQEKIYWHQESAGEPQGRARREPGAAAAGALPACLLRVEAAWQTGVAGSRPVSVCPRPVLAPAGGAAGSWRAVAWPCAGGTGSCPQETYKLVSAPISILIPASAGDRAGRGAGQHEAGRPPWWDILRSNL